MESREAQQLIKVLKAAYPDKRMLPETVELYCRCLIDLPYPLAQAAVLAHISQNKWFPTVAELREAAIQLQPGGRLPTELEAWAEVMREIEDKGNYAAPVFSCDVIAKAVKAMGWRQLCLSENIMADRAHFFRIYGVYCERVRRDMVLLPEVQELVKQIPEGGRPELPANMLRLADAKRMKAE